MSEELKPCPKCGSRVKVTEDAACNASIVCQICSIKFGPCFGIDILTRAWNTRAVSPELASLKAEVETVKAERNRIGVEVRGPLIAEIGRLKSEVEKFRSALEWTVARLEHMKFIIENPNSVEAGFGFSETIQALHQKLPAIKEMSRWKDPSITQAKEALKG